MEERKQAWAARGWDYVPVLVAEDEKPEVAAVTNGVNGVHSEDAGVNGEETRLPTRVWGEHAA